MSTTSSRLGLVTGATGYVGGELAGALLERGWRVRTELAITEQGLAESRLRFTEMNDAYARAPERFSDTQLGVAVDVMEALLAATTGLGGQAAHHGPMTDA